MPANASTIDPVKYEMYVHRLVTIAEEGRIALQKVCASPIVVQGGECMSAFLRRRRHDDPHGFRTSPFFRPLRRRGESIIAPTPRIQASTKAISTFSTIRTWVDARFDQMVVKPIFHAGTLVAWTASMTHTADTGGVLRGGRPRSFTRASAVAASSWSSAAFAQRRVSQFDRTMPRPAIRRARSEIAYRGEQRLFARFMALIEKYGIAFIAAANAKLVADSESMARRGCVRCRTASGKRLLRTSTTSKPATHASGASIAR